MAAKKLEYLIIHTTDTPYDREVIPDDIYLWHLGALRNTDGSYTFKGKRYTADSIKNVMLTLPSGKQLHASKSNGRGWTRVGYSDMIQRSGKIVNLVPYTFDDVLTEWEITNGATNYNSISRHVVLVGGWYKDGSKVSSKDNLPTIDVLYTTEQIETLKSYIAAQLQIVPTLKVIGHQDVSTKTCPNFNVKEWFKTI
jgi:hypothetical protein